MDNQTSAFLSPQTITVAGTNHEFEIAGFPSPEHANEALWVVEGTWDATRAAADHISFIRRDERYSDIGRAQKVDPLVTGALDHLLTGWSNLGSFARSIDRREHDLIGIPAVDPQNIVSHLRSAEIRARWETMTADQRAEIMRNMGGEIGEEIAFAILRSPFPQASTEVQFFQNRWADLRREANPIEAAAIVSAREAIDWAERNLNYTGVAIKSVAQWESDRILTHAVSSNDGFFAPVAHRLGFPKEQVAQKQLRLQLQAA